MSATAQLTKAGRPRSLPILDHTGRGSFYRPELDALRFFAFLGVFQFHYAFSVSSHLDRWGAPRWLFLLNNATFAGAFGVDLFFVLSAYLITELLLREKEQRGALDVGAFYIRRILRIWPLYFFCVGLAVVPFFNPLRGFSGRYVLAYLLLAGNWSFVAWGMPAHTIAGPLWTVSIEEQFYLLWPPLVRVLSRNRIMIAAVGMLVLSTSARISLLLFHLSADSVRFNTLARLDPIAVGILVAVFLRGRMPDVAIAHRLAMLCVGLITLVLISHYWRLDSPRSLAWTPTLAGFPLIAASCTLILLSALGISARLPRLIVYLGKISYGLYVYHALGTDIAWRLIPSRLVPSNNGVRHLALRELLALLITIALASFSYVLIEKPFLRLKKRFEVVRSRPV